MNKYFVVVLVLLWGLANCQRSSGQRRRPSGMGNLFFPNRPPPPPQSGRQVNSNFPIRPLPNQSGQPGNGNFGRPLPNQSGRPGNGNFGRPLPNQSGRPGNSNFDRPLPNQSGRPGNGNFGNGNFGNNNFGNNNFGPALFPTIEDEGGRGRPNRGNDFERDRGRRQGDQDRGDEWMSSNFGMWNGNGNSNNNNNGNRGNGNDNGNSNGNNNNGNRGTTTFRPTLQAPLAVVHNPPQGCNCQYPPQYNPVCGSDGQNYKNQALLECVNRCGTRVTMRRRGTC